MVSLFPPSIYTPLVNTTSFKVRVPESGHVNNLKHRPDPWDRHDWNPFRIAHILSSTSLARSIVLVSQLLLDGVRYWFLVAAYSKPIAGSMLLFLKPSLDGGSM